MSLPPLETVAGNETEDTPLSSLAATLTVKEPDEAVLYQTVEPEA